MSLYATGRTSGIVLNSGSSLTFSVPVYEGFSLSHCIMHNNIAGDALDLYLK